MKSLSFFEEAAPESIAAPSAERETVCFGIRFDEPEPEL